MTGAVIEPATPDDLPGIRALDARVLGSAERGDSLARAVDDGRCAVARLDGEIAGFVTHDRSFFGRPYVALLVVDPRFRRRGIGTSLITSVVAALEDRPIFTSTNSSNVAMRRLLRKLGWRPSGRIDNLDPGDPELIFVWNEATAGR